MGLNIKATPEEIGNWVAEYYNSDGALRDYGITEELIKRGIVDEIDDLKNMSEMEMRSEILEHRRKDRERVFELNVDDVGLTHITSLSTAEKLALIKKHESENVDMDALLEAVALPFKGMVVDGWMRSIRSSIRHEVRKNPGYLAKLEKYMVLSQIIDPYLCEKFKETEERVGE